MSDEIDCAHCGARMQSGGVCPVCELGAPVAALPRSPLEPAPSTSRVGRLWQSGQLALGLGAAMLLLSVPLPLMTHIPLRTGDTSLSTWDLILGTSPAFRGRLAWMVPGAAVFLLSLLRSRKLGSSMRASRPLALVVSLAPAVAVAMPFALLHKHNASAGVGVGALLAGLGVFFASLGALRFGEAVPDVDPRAIDDDD